MGKMVSVNSKRLRLAREHYGLSIEAVSKETKIKADKLIEFENADDYPSYAQMTRLAEYYNQPILFFFFKSDPPKTDELTTAFRSIEQSTNRGIGKKAKELIELANIYRLNLSELNEGQKPISFASIVQREQVNKNALTDWLRDKLELPLEKQIRGFGSSAQLLEFIREKLYNLGIYIFKDSFRDNSISGLCLYDEIFPVILLNNKTTFGRQLFTVFHELYHILLKNTDLDFTRGTEESECNRFASEFLIPASDFNEQILSIDLGDDMAIARLAERYCVSLGAVKYRLFKAQKISRADYEKSWESDNIRIFNSQNAGGNYYSTKISYLGNAYLKQVFTQYYSGQIPLSTVGLYTQSKSSNVSKLAATMNGGEF